MHIFHWQHAVPPLEGHYYVECSLITGLIEQPFAAGEAAAGANLLNQPVNERMLEQLLAGEWQVTGDKFHSCIAALKATCCSGTSKIVVWDRSVVCSDWCV